MKIVAIIPARGGSKGIKFKNIRDVCGKPLIYYQIKNALDTALIDKVVLASDSDAIFKVAKNYFGYKIDYIKRPPEISTDNSKTEETLLYVLNQLQEDFDIVVTLEPTNPLNKPEHIKRCIKLLVDTSYDAVYCGVRDISFSVTDMRRFNRPMRNKIQGRVKECGNCWATKVDALRTWNNRLGKTNEFILIPEEDSYHLDSESDWIIIEALMRHRLQTKYYMSKGKRVEEDLYDRRYWKTVIDPDGVSRDKTKERLKRLAFCKEELTYINNLKPGKVLDVGCGLGFLLSGINPGWDKHGVEISEFGAGYAKRFGKVLCGLLHKAEYQSDSFDVVILNHVIEHMKNPIDELLEIKRILKPGGKLILGTPDFECATAKRFGKNFRLLKDESHLSLFGALGIYRLLTDLFFEVEKISRPFFDTEYFTEENLLRLFDTTKTSPPFYGNVITLYAYKK